MIEQLFCDHILPGPDWSTIEGGNAPFLVINIFIYLYILFHFFARYLLILYDHSVSYF